MTSSYKFGHFEVVPALRQVLANGAPQALGAKAFDLMVCLLRQRSRVMSKNELLTQVWPGLVVAENNLSVQIVALRKLFGGEAIVTVQGHGFRFGLEALEVPRAGLQAPAETPSAAPSPDTPGLVIPAIAVMPFASQTGDGHADQLALAFAADLIADLARHKELRTISRFSSFSLKSQGLSSRAVCARLNARFLVSGQIQLSETQVDWSLEMVEGQSDEIVWSEQQSLAVSDLPAARSSLVRHLSAWVVSCS